MEHQVYIKKSNGETELFSFEKLKRSLRSAGANQETVETIVEKIQGQIYDGMSSNTIYRKAFSILKGKHKSTASR